MIGPVVGPVPELRFGTIRCLLNLVSDGPFVVTFSNWHPEGVAHQAFGVDFLKSLGINAAHIVAAKSDWFTDDEDGLQQTFDAITALEQFKSATIRLGYGSSMGGYAALRYRHILRLDRLLVYCPQYSIHPDAVGFEKRWAVERKRHGPLCPPIDAVKAGEDVTIAYDSSILSDAAHVQLIDPDRRSKHIKLPFSGHPPMPFLAETGELRPLFMAVLEGGSAMDVAQHAYQKRRQSPAYWSRLAEYWLEKPQINRRLQKGLWALRHAAALQPGNQQYQRSVTRLEQASRNA